MEYDKIAKVSCTWAQRLAKPGGNRSDSSPNSYMFGINA